MVRARRGLGCLCERRVRGTSTAMRGEWVETNCVEGRGHGEEMEASACSGCSAGKYRCLGA